jgi:ribulose-phosphate 3-epimerase
MREESLSKKGILFLGMGISGGEYGARHGPSLMPGGSEEAYNRVRPILEASAAQVEGEPCVAYLGPRSAGHDVKMVHNGIEYGIMQLIAESYDLLRRGLDFDVERLRAMYAIWNEGKLNSYLIEITTRVLGRKDDNTGKPLVTMILDRARQKGAGKRTSWDALDLQTPVPTIDIAVAMRNISDYKEERQKAGQALSGPSKSFQGDEEAFARQVTKLPLDVHLMIGRPEKYVEAFVKAGGDWIGVQVEAVTHLHRVIQNIKELGAKATVVLNPATSLTAIENVINDVDMVLIMTVNPGFGGQAFIHTMLPKVRKCREMIDERNPAVLLEVDGGVHEDTIDGLVEAGVDVFVAGSAVFGKGDYGANILVLKAHMRKEK